jgi:hypothetical protein
MDDELLFSLLPMLAAIAPLGILQLAAETARRSIRLAVTG